MIKSLQGIFIFCSIGFFNMPTLFLPGSNIIENEPFFAPGKYSRAD